jgi:2-oxoglutarate ferredoxin oxidoreductase subunit beta
MDRDPVHLKEMLRRANGHKGTSFLEIYQNCNVFNDGAFEIFTDKDTKKAETLFVENGKPLVFGQNNDKGIKLDGFKPVVVNLADGHSANDLWIHDERDTVKAGILARFFENPRLGQHTLPRPFGVFFTSDRHCYEESMNYQVDHAIQTKGTGDLDKLLRGNETWEIH